MIEFDGLILGKPSNKENALETLKRYCHFLFLLNFNYLQTEWKKTCCLYWRSINR